MKNVFMQHLPERFASIEQTWKSAINAGDAEGQNERLLSLVQDLVGSSGKVGLIDISEVAYALENQISLLDTQLPQEEPRQRIEGMLLRLKELINQSVSEQFITTIKPGDKIAFFLRASDDLAPGLSSSLEGLGFSVLTFIHPDDVEGELQKRIPDIIIFDGLFLNQMMPLFRELRLQQESIKHEIPTICLNTSKSLEQRLLALRSGVKAYFLHPFAIPKVIEKIQQLTSPGEDGYKILIIEDDPSQAKFAASILEKGGMTTEMVIEPLNTLEALQRFRPDLILMDLYMPDADGKELTTIIREQPEFVTTPIVFLSGEHDTDKKLHALSAGGDDFLTKPIRPKHLINTISNRVKRAKSLQESGKRNPLSLQLDSATARHYFDEQLDNLIAEKGSQSMDGGILDIQLHNKARRNIGFTDSQIETLIKQLKSVVTPLLDEKVTLAEDENGLLLLSRIENAKQLLTLASSLQSAIKHHFFEADGDELKVNSSIGICLFDEDISEATQMIDRAAAAAQQAMKGGGEQILIFDSQFNTLGVVSERSKITNLVESSIREDCFQIIFQPLIDRDRSDNIYADMGLRLRHGREIISRQEWYPIATEKRLLSDLDRLAIQHALDALEGKRREGREANIFAGQSFQSVIELSNIEWLRAQLRQRQMVGTGLILEYVIADLGQDLKTAKTFLKELQEMGLSISLSRFGANTAAMRVLQFLEVNYIRIATPILKHNQEAAEKLVREIHILGAKVILPRVSDPKLIPDHWKALADLQPGM